MDPPQDMLTGSGVSLAQRSCGREDQALHSGTEDPHPKDHLGMPGNPCSRIGEATTGDRTQTVQMVLLFSGLRGN
ncbi:hypothetical protein DC3_51750 [Deinococcus cellulosilyticus NBRC 106333 = KACC 11606]|uniref:Uncharacterized protein n=1 Tax=Deinococcus cellulosilyticus (strain DSM 18568 / NBRC 106333 / KACC 11606 / 5516J-15) TaxID=1223518 RepID=A0A511N9R6_DEIC1|nr:hypothetical protein DC3_51750 [Deinococcus cellulosilyticus NBRC 106333 = KACC 11606]